MSTKQDIGNILSLLQSRSTESEIVLNYYRENIISYRAKHEKALAICDLLRSVMTEDDHKITRSVRSNILAHVEDYLS